MDRDKVKVILKDAINKAFNDVELMDNRTGYVGDDTVNQMAEAALSVLLAVEDVQDYLKRERLLND